MKSSASRKSNYTQTEKYLIIVVLVGSPSRVAHNSVFLDQHVVGEFVLGVFLEGVFLFEIDADIEIELSIERLCGGHHFGYIYIPRHF